MSERLSFADRIKDAPRWIIGYLRDYFGFFLASLSGLVIAVCAAIGIHDKFVDFSNNPIGRVILCFGALGFVGFVLQIFQQKSRSKIESELRSALSKAAENQSRLDERHAAAASCFREHLAAIGSKMDFKASERMSVYKYRKDDKFRIVGRYSENANFNNVHREVYEPGQGILSQAFLQVERVDYEVPYDPNGDYQKYKMHQFETYGVPAAVVDSFKMRSVSYSAFPIKDKNGTKCLGVLVCESTLPKRMTAIDYNIKILREVELVRDSLRHFIEAADEMDDYLLQSQLGTLAAKNSNAQKGETA